VIVMSEDKICHLRCNTCKAQTTGSSLESCLKSIKCLSDGGELDETCAIALRADGKAVFELKQVIKDDYKGETVLKGEAKPVEPKTEEPKTKEPKNETQEKIIPEEVPEEEAPVEEAPTESDSQ